MDEYNTAEAIAELEDDMRIYRRSIALGDALQRLKNNNDFKFIFEEHLLVEECARIVQSLSDPEQQDERAQRNLHIGIKAIGYVGQFMRSIIATANQADKSLAHAEQDYMERFHEAS